MRDHYWKLVGAACVLALPLFFVDLEKLFGRDIWCNAAGIALGLFLALHKRELLISLLAVPALALVASSLLMTFLTGL